MYYAKKEDGSIDCFADSRFMIESKDYICESPRLSDVLDNVVVVTKVGRPIIVGLEHVQQWAKSAKIYGATWTKDGLSYIAEFKDGRWSLLREKHKMNQNKKK